MSKEETEWVKQGKNLKESSQILVCKDAAKQRDEIISNGDRAIVYYF